MFFEADPDGASEVIPEDLELPVPTEAIITFFKFPFSTLGPYNEFAVDIKVLLDGQEKYYTAYNYVNSDVGLAAGREIWGVPKKNLRSSILRGVLTWSMDSWRDLRD